MSSVAESATGRRGLPTSALEWVLVFQPVFGWLVFLSLLAGYPPLWLSWLLFLGLLVARWHRGWPVLVRTPFDIPIAILFAGLLAGLAVTPDLSVSAGAIQTYLICFINYYGFISGGRRYLWYWKLTSLVVFVFILLVSVATFVQTGEGARILPFNRWLYTLAGHLPFSVTYPFGPNALGTMLGAAVPALAAFTVLATGRRQKAVAGGFTILCLGLLLMSASSNGLIAALCGLVILAAIIRPWVLGLIIPAALFALWLIVSFWYPEWPFAWLLPIPTLVSRFPIWQSTLELLKTSPIAGLGPGAWYGRYVAATGHDIATPHSDYLQIWADAGLAGLLALAITAGIAFVLAWKPWRSGEKSDRSALSLSAGIALAALAINGVFETFVAALLIIGPPAEGALPVFHSVALPYHSFFIGLLVITWQSNRNKPLKVLRQSTDEAPEDAPRPGKE